MIPVIRYHFSLAAPLAALFSTAALLSGSPAFAVDILVPSQQPTIQAAITAAADGDRIVVAAGTYNEHLTWTGKSVSLKGAGKATTIIDGTNTGQCLLFNATAAVTIDGFTFRNGKAKTSGTNYVLREGAAICAYAPGRLVTVTNCTFASNTGNLDGAHFQSPTPPMGRSLRS